MYGSRLTTRGWGMAWVAAMFLFSIISVQPAQAAEASIDNPVVETGGRLVVRASGFRRNEAVVTWASSARGSVYATEKGSVDSQGNISINIHVKRFWEPGYWAITIHGLDSGREAIATFEVKTGLPDGELTLSANTLAPGAILTASGDNFKSGELVSAWVTRPDGTADAVAASPIRPSGGDIKFSYEIPFGAQLGTWSVTAYGNGSDRILISHFNVAH